MILYSGFLPLPHIPYTIMGYFLFSWFFWFLWWYVGRWSLTLLDLLYFINMGLWFFNIFDRDLNRAALRVHGERETSRSFEIGRSPSSNSEMFRAHFFLYGAKCWFYFFLAKTSMLQMILKMLKTLKTETNQCFFRPFSKNLESSWCLMSFARSIISMILGFSRKAEKNLRFSDFESGWRVRNPR